MSIGFFYKMKLMVLHNKSFSRSEIRYFTFLYFIKNIEVHEIKIHAVIKIDFKKYIQISKIM